MPKPREVFDDPATHWQFITTPKDTDFEGQYFDRKEIPRESGRLQLRSFRFDEVAPTVSAFANSNREGGLLVLGVASDGAFTGCEHLDENQRATIGTVNEAWC